MRGETVLLVGAYGVSTPVRFRPSSVGFRASWIRIHRNRNASHQVNQRTRSVPTTEPRNPPVSGFRPAFRPRLGDSGTAHLITSMMDNLNKEAQLTHRCGIVPLRESHGVGLVSGG